MAAIAVLEGPAGCSWRPRIAAGIFAVDSLARPSHRVTGGTEANLATGQERRAERCGTSGKRRDAHCRQRRPAHHAEGGSPTRRVALARPSAASRASTVSESYAFRRAPGGPAPPRPGGPPAPTRRRGPGWRG